MKGSLRYVISLEQKPYTLALHRLHKMNDTMHATIAIPTLIQNVDCQH